MKSPQTPRKPKKAVDLLVQSPYFSPEKGNSDSEKASPTKDNLEDGLPVLVALELAPDVKALHKQLVNLKPTLIQERVAHDPWKLLIAVMLLNKTAGKLAIPVFWTLVERWPTPLHLSQANPEELVDLIRPLGTQTIRANRLVDLSKAYMKDPPSSHDVRPSRYQGLSSRNSPFFSSPRGRYPATSISHLPGSGTYALDSYRIFCTCHDDPFSEEWKSVQAADKELVRYLKWKWAFVEYRQWSSGKGPGRPVTAKYLRSLIADLQDST